jgi:hypothetical protein
VENGGGEGMVGRCGGCEEGKKREGKEVRLEGLVGELGYDIRHLINVDELDP